MASRAKAKPGAKRKRSGGKDKDKKTQAERFKETARKLEVDETGEQFERAFRKIVPPKQRSA